MYQICKCAHPPMAVTMKMIAERAGISVPSVSYVLNNRDTEIGISAALAAKIRGIAKEMNYVPNAMARSMATRKNRQVGVLVGARHAHKMTSTRAMETIMGITAGLEASGNLLVVIPVMIESAADQVESRIFRERSLDGLVMLDQVPMADAERAKSLVKAAVWVNAGVWQETDCIRRDEYAAGALVASQLLLLGYRKFIYGDKSDQSHFSTVDRWRGVAAVAKEHGIPVEKQVTSGSLKPTPLTRPFSAVTRETAVIACDVYRAVRLHAEYAREGIRPGRDFGFACCDDSIDLSWTWPSLARVGFDRFAMGKRAAEMLLQQMADPGAEVKSELVDEPWIFGDSAAPVTGS